VLAKHYGLQHRAEYEGLWWINAESRESLIDGLITLGRGSL